MKPLEYAAVPLVAVGKRWGEVHTPGFLIPTVPSASRLCHSVAVSPTCLCFLLLFWSFLYHFVSFWYFFVVYLFNHRLKSEQYGNLDKLLRKQNACTGRMSTIEHLPGKLDPLRWVKTMVQFRGCAEAAKLTVQVSTWDDGPRAELDGPWPLSQTFKTWLKFGSGSGFNFNLPMAKKKVMVDVISDVVWPFCWIGKRNLEGAMKQTPDLRKFVGEKRGKSPGSSFFVKVLFEELFQRNLGIWPMKLIWTLYNHVLSQLQYFSSYYSTTLWGVVWFCKSLVCNMSLRI